MSELIKLTKKLWNEYFSGDVNNISKLSNMFEEYSVIIGTGKHEFYYNLEEFKVAINAEFQERKDIKFKIQYLECDEIVISSDASLIYGKVAIRWKNDEGTVAINMDSRFSILYKKINKLWKILHIHQSTPNLEQIGEESYPKTLVHEVETAHEKINLLSQLVETDGLTGLINIRTLKERYINWDKNNAWIFVIDIDNFKEVNDNYGHLQGNNALISLANILINNIRKTDLACRMGGDEFILLCAGLRTPEDAKNLARRIMNDVLIWTKENSPFYSISMGITRLGVDELFDVAFKRADQALYDSKRSGKSQISFL